jgi:alkylation response protein AidB-like acyl-CoA dehydrogenase
MDVVVTAQRLADEVLFPAALATDAAEAVPVELLDALADAGLYGLAGPIDAGGLDADFATVCAVVEALASGCLTTAFAWVQHLGAVLTVASSENAALRDEWIGPLCRGECRAGLALGGAVPGPAKLVARETDDGWTFDGGTPFLSGWGRIDVVHTAARTDDGRVVWAFVDATESPALEVKRLELVALNATATVRATFREHPVPAGRVTSVSPFRDGPTPPPVLAIHGSLALGVAARCCTLLGPSPLDDELAACRAELGRLDPETIEAARASAGELALRAAAALVTQRGSRSLLVEDHTQRLAREALFALVYALRPGSRDELLSRLGAATR